MSRNLILHPPWTQFYKVRKKSVLTDLVAQNSESKDHNLRRSTSQVLETAVTKKKKEIKNKEKSWLACMIFSEQSLLLTEFPAGSVVAEVGEDEGDRLFQVS